MNSHAAPPMVSIIMPAYNAASYLAETITSVLNQTYANWELLVLDDASTDDTLAVARQFETDPRVHVIPCEKIGSPAGVRNRGLQRCRGDFITFMDADDVYYSDALQALVEALYRHPQWHAVYGFKQNMDEHGHDIRQSQELVELPDGQLALPPGYPLNWESILSGHVMFYMPNLMMRRTAFERVGFFQEEILSFDDFLYYLRLYLLGFEGMGCIPAYIYRYRIYRNSLSRSPTRYLQAVKSNINGIDWIFSEAGIPERYHKLKSKMLCNRLQQEAFGLLKYRQRQLARDVLHQARMYPDVSSFDWLLRCLPVYLLSLLPGCFRDGVFEARRALLSFKAKRAIQGGAS